MALVHAFSMGRTWPALRAGTILVASGAWASHLALNPGITGVEEKLLDPIHVAVMASATSYIIAGSQAVSRFTGAASSLLALLACTWTSYPSPAFYLTATVALLVLAASYSVSYGRVRPGFWDYFSASLSSLLLVAWLFATAIGGEAVTGGWMVSLLLVTFYSAGYLAISLARRLTAMAGLGSLLLSASLSYTLANVVGWLSSLQAIACYTLFMLLAYIAVTRNARLATSVLVAVSLMGLAAILASSLGYSTDLASFWIEPPGRWSVSTITGSYVEIAVTGYEYEGESFRLSLQLMLESQLAGKASWRGTINLGEPASLEKAVIVVASFPDLVIVHFIPGELLKASVLADYTLYSIPGLHTPYIGGDVKVKFTFVEDWLLFCLLFFAAVASPLMIYMLYPLALLGVRRRGL